LGHAITQTIAEHRRRSAIVKKICQISFSPFSLLLLLLLTGFHIGTRGVPFQLDLLCCLTHLSTSANQEDD
ncbi:hypothetical protein B0H14DRAFT_3126766, partial [Mycena olivaceomarginata]